ncbi:hypothetical protein GCM10023149_48770 [Mucilaginibacter gynuensis]|uniref:Uncharacterized protein n=1 Tax=Mucilaginibacter gynuensis TaxID=1302236 RepID=A0ABP8HG31_9SPHI
MIKQTMTPERMNRIKSSVQFMLIMAEMIQIEYQQDMDVRFKNPQVNQFAGRIIKDAQAIHFHLKNNDKVNIQISDSEFVEEYGIELHRVFKFFIGLPLSQVKEVMDNLESVSTEVSV